MPAKRRTPDADPGRLRYEDLLRAFKGSASWAEFADRMPRDAAGRPSPGSDRLEQITQYGIREFPKVRIMRNVAIGLGVTERVILEACATSLEFALDQRNARLDAVLMPPGVEQLPDAVLWEIRAHIVSLIRAYTPHSGS